MTHFLARLVERTRGTAARVEPLIASRFASAPGPELPVEPEAAGPEVRAAVEAGKMAAQPLVTKTEFSERPAELRNKGEEIPHLFEPTEGHIEVVRERLLVPPTVPAASLSLVVRRPGTAEHERNPDSKPAAPSSSNRPAPVRARSRPAPPLRPADLPNEQPAGERPIVRVTIGRIEVRAAPAPAAAPRRAAKEAQPALSLDAYLKSRREGAR